MLINCLETGKVRLGEKLASVNTVINTVLADWCFCTKIHKSCPSSIDHFGLKMQTIPACSAGFFDS